MEEKIRIENVTKKFGSYAALDGISLNFEKGKIHGIIGRNGSGKTVLFKCICGFLRVDGGAVLVNGKQVGKEIEAPESIGAIIETPGFLPGYSARQNLQFLAGIRGKIGKKEIVQEMRQLFLKLKDEGKTILLASHNREDIAALCDTTVEIDRGKIVK